MFLEKHRDVFGISPFSFFQEARDALFLPVIPRSYLPVPVHVHLCQMLSGGPCLCLPSHHLQNHTCNKNTPMPISKLAA